MATGGPGDSPRRVGPEGDSGEEDNNRKNVTTTVRKTLSVWK